MEEKIREWKDDFETSKKLDELLKKKFFGKQEIEESRKSEGIIMLDLRSEILYGEKYLEIFMNNLVETNIAASEKKYNIGRINRHLEKILEEYTQITNELDEIIFSKKEQEKYE